MKANYYFVLIFPVLVFAGCASYVDLGNGRALKTVMTEDRSPFGTNGGFMQLQECDKTREPNQPTLYNYDKNCTPKSNWIPVSSQGVGGQLVGGALAGVGAAVGGALVDTGASVVQSVVVPAAKGGHH
jgi:hypothetical protein